MFLLIITCFALDNCLQWLNNNSLSVGMIRLADFSHSINENSRGHMGGHEGQV